MISLPGFGRNDHSPNTALALIFTANSAFIGVSIVTAVFISSKIYGFALKILGFSEIGEKIISIVPTTISAIGVPGTIAGLLVAGALVTAVKMRKSSGSLF